MARVVLDSVSSSCWTAAFRLPADMKPGQYTLALANNLNFSNVVSMGITDPSQRLVNVVESIREVVVGTVPAGDVARLESLLNASSGIVNASTRAVVKLAAGKWLMDALADLAVPDGVVVRGADMKTTILSWPTQTGHMCLTRKSKWGVDSSGAMIASSRRGAFGGPTRSSGGPSVVFGWGLEDLTVEVRGGFDQNDTKVSTGPKHHLCDVLFL